MDSDVHHAAALSIKDIELPADHVLEIGRAQVHHFIALLVVDVVTVRNRNKLLPGRRLNCVRLIVV